MKKELRKWLAVLLTSAMVLQPGGTALAAQETAAAQEEMAAEQQRAAKEKEESEAQSEAQRKAEEQKAKEESEAESEAQRKAEEQKAKEESEAQSEAQRKAEEQKAKEESEQKASEEQRAKEESEAQSEAQRKAEEQKAKEESEQKASEEQRAKEESEAESEAQRKAEEQKAKEESEQKASEEQKVTESESQTQTPTEPKTEAPSEKETEPRETLTEEQTEEKTEKLTEEKTEEPTEETTESETETETEIETEETESETGKGYPVNDGEKITSSKLQQDLQAVLPYLIAARDFTGQELSEEDVLTGEAAQNALSSLKTTARIIANARSSSDVAVVNLYADEKGKIDTEQLEEKFGGKTIDVSGRYVLINVVASSPDQDLELSGYELVYGGNRVTYEDVSRVGYVLYNFTALQDDEFVDYRGTVTLSNGGGLKGTWLAPAGTVNILSDLSGAVYADKVSVSEQSVLQKIVLIRGRDLAAEEAEREDAGSEQTEPVTEENSSETEMTSEAPTGEMETEAASEALTGET
ncbi:MAG: hypothetical protein Q4C59_08270, partial [Lachnospiraceae bacterium]|nr:hypothetical protein [Lachnospiraceae bacterium]